MGFFTGKQGRILLLVGIILFLTFPLFVSRFYVYLTTVILIYGLFATSLNLVLGYGGIFQFNHAVFFGMGAYGAALVITRSDLSPWIGFLVGPLVSALMSLIIGLICIRLSKLYFGMLQISLGSLIWAVVYRWYGFTGGDDGIHGIPMPDIISSSTNTYYFTLFIVSLAFFTIYKIIKSPFGSVIQGIRDNPIRSKMIGVDVPRHQLVAIVFSGFFAGIAGVLFVIVENAVFPDMLFWTLSLEAMIMCLLGGMYTFMGPIFGAMVIVLLRTSISTFTVYWGLFLGIILMFIIFFLPDGVLGHFQKVMDRKQS
ncbi:amino acid or sugar ABC transport system, permease protein [delta proteobacterium NaphS2]|nr:amino acid or sugar ABC transport system, permease protein [delta proteobacterium NaphS2]